MADAPVTIYSAPWCAFCHATKQYFDSKKIPYTDKDIEKDPVAARESVQKSGQMGIPVVDIDGTIIIGFDRPKIDATLRDKKLIDI
ncbi:NrdH-redoxin [Candidatus Saccharibacteria bacterium]|nr:NrdH-redoxin [Candidatus Saccharibacteria bacterium]MBI3338016.1 NrdH-redoxin [Candidatus Saccharibacteria bacterium]